MSASKFLTAHVLGSVLAAVIVLAATTPPGNASGWFLGMFGLGVTFAMFGALPALFIGLPALTSLLRSNYWPSVRLCFLAMGGGLVGALSMFVTFTGFEKWGAICGASIGMMQGLMFYGHRSRRALPPTS